MTGKIVRNKAWIFAILVHLALSVSAQSLLDRKVELDVDRQRLDNVLEILGNKGGFYFSYNSNIIPRDSLITLHISGTALRQVLTQLLGAEFEFRESGRYVIIRRVPIRVTQVTQKSASGEKIYTVSGFVYDEQSGRAIVAANIYEKDVLASAMTDQNGFFKITLKSKTSKAALTVSKTSYSDTTVEIEPKFNQEIYIVISPEMLPANVSTIISPAYIVPETVSLNTDSISGIPANLDILKVERTGLARFFLSYRQKISSLNLRNFFADRPFQLSLTPGLSTHGKLSSQVVNNISLNMLGGYTGGLNGVELGGLFNIDKKDVRYVQAGGLFNLVGGKMQGVQLAGLNNTVLDTVHALQAAGISNIVKGRFTGLQAAGIYNHVMRSVSGVQAGGIGNFANGSVEGMQVAGIANFSNQEMEGLQVAGIINYSRKLRGVQIGLINIADSSSGYSIGLLNIVLKGYHKLGLYSNELTPLNAAFKTGNSKFYSILLGGADTRKGQKLYSFGYGLGTEIPVGKMFYLNPELSSQYLYAGSWDFLNLQNKLDLQINLRLGKNISLFAGPSYSVLVSDQPAAIPGYKFPLVQSDINSHRFSDRAHGWIGWSAGINLF